jgi:hypothetical protein
MRIEAFARGLLDNVTEVHHRNLWTEVSNDSEVVCDEQERNVEFFLQSLKQVNDLSLNRHVQCRDGFIGYEQLWLQCQRACDANALTLAAGEFVGVPVVVFGVQTHELQKFLHPFESVFLGNYLVNFERCRNDLTDGQSRVERRVGVLKDHLDVAPKGLQLARGCRRNVYALK